MSVEMERQDQYRRLLQIMELLGKAEASLNRNRVRLFEQQKVDAAWILSVSEVPEREDLLESFASKFNRFQDMMGDKLLPALLIWKGERPGAFIDNLNRAERLEWIASAQLWLEARALRNKLVHEYMDDAEVFAQSLNLANELSLMLLETWQNMKYYVG
ncbi:MAG: hypothetical protein Q9M16_03010, partial [Mariprofundus sp.]|nr:hypothetical protein [Mariprofundus sp.]